jgi:hypothetical protein
MVAGALHSDFLSLFPVSPKIKINWSILDFCHDLVILPPQIELENPNTNMMLHANLFSIVIP